jgi:hypothetical protein
LSKGLAVVHTKDGDMIKNETRVFHLPLEDAKEIRIISQQKALAVIIVKNQASVKVSNVCNFLCH